MMFRITDCKGFYWGFSNGWGLSVQWGAGNYADNYDMGFHEVREQRRLASNVAEIAIITPTGDLYSHPDFDGNTVKGYCSPDDVFKYLEFTKNQEAKNAS